MIVMKRASFDFSDEPSTMKLLLQRVTSARVEVDDQNVGEIDRGMLVFVGVEKTDTSETVPAAVARLLKFRLFADEAGKMNGSLNDTANHLLLVPQFTLAADTRKGNRPGFSVAARPDVAEGLFDEMAEQLLSILGPGRFATGQFGADMAVHLTNDGPVTFLLDL